MMKSISVNVIEDPETGELILPFPSEFMDQLGWKEGDTICWKNHADGTFLLTKSTTDNL